MPDKELTVAGEGLILHQYGGLRVERIQWFRETPKKVQSVSDGLFYWKDDVKKFTEEDYTKLVNCVERLEQARRDVEELPAKIRELFTKLPAKFYREEENEQNGVQSGNGEGDIAGA